MTEQSEQWWLSYFDPYGQFLGAAIVRAADAAEAASEAYLMGIDPRVDSEWDADIASMGPLPVDERLARCPIEKFMSPAEIEAVGVELAECGHPLLEEPWREAPTLAEVIDQWVADGVMESRSVEGGPDEYRMSARFSSVGNPQWWLSFADPDLPEGEQFLGAAIVKAADEAAAMTISHFLGINPGGEVAIMGPLPVDERWRHYPIGELMSRAEIEVVEKVAECGHPRFELPILDDDVPF
jgi:hypothetical protein